MSEIGERQGASARPVVDLMGGHAGEAGEAGLSDAATGWKGGEFRMEKRSHGALIMELSSIPEALATVWVTP